MGGGDLNTKKSWHPNTLKNQERVWAAERAAGQEQARIQELQRERQDERGRDQLKALGRSVGTLPEETEGDKLSWMYNQPNKSGDTEDYLLGKTIDKNYERLIAEDKTSAPPKNAVEHEVIPFSIRQLRSGAAVPDTQVDLARKLQEDPLAAVRRRELEARAQLLQNPLRLHQLTQLLRQDKEKRKQKKEKKKAKKNKLDIDKLLAEKLSGLQNKHIDLASLLSSKKKKKKKKRSNCQSSSASEDDRPKKKKKKKDSNKEETKKKRDPDSDPDEKQKGKPKHPDRSEDSLYNNKRKLKDKKSSEEHPRKRQKGSSDSDSDEQSRRRRKESSSSLERKKHKAESAPRNKVTKESDEKIRKKHKVCEEDNAEKKPKYKEVYSHSHHRSRSSPSREIDRRNIEHHPNNPHSKHVPSRKDSSDSETEQQPKHFGLVSSDGKKLHTSRHNNLPAKKQAKKEEVWKRPVPEKLSEQEKEKRLREMMSSANQREKERESNLKQHRHDMRHEEQRATQHDFDSEFATRQAARAAGASVQHRIRSNVYNIQRAGRHMEQNFAKR